MSYDIFKSYGLDKVHDSLTENYDYKENDPQQWHLVKCKEVMDSDGFLTDYCWYTNNNKHIFMFGDKDVYEPDEDYADWECDTEERASEWFDNYEGFVEDSNGLWSDFEEDSFDESLTGNADFMNDGFYNVYGDGLKLED